MRRHHRRILRAYFLPWYFEGWHLLYILRAHFLPQRVAIPFEAWQMWTRQTRHASLVGRLNRDLGYLTPTAKIDVPKSEPAAYGGSWRLRGWQRMTIKVLQVQREFFN